MESEPTLVGRRRRDTAFGRPSLSGRGEGGYDGASASDRGSMWRSPTGPPAPNPSGVTMASEVPASPRWRPRRVDLHLFLISFAILFFELACIRWFGSTVLFLTFFTNLILMACFLGISVGCLAASEAPRPHQRGPPADRRRDGPGLRGALGLPQLGGGDDRRRGPAVSPADLLRDREPAQRPLAVRRPDRVGRRPLLRPGRPHVPRPGPGPGPALQRVAQPRRRLHDEHPGEPGRDRRVRARLVVSHAPLVWFAIGGGLCLLFTMRRHLVQVAWFVALLGLLCSGPTRSRGTATWSGRPITRSSTPTAPRPSS